MPKIMADHNVEGHLQVLLNIASSPEWSDIWSAVACEIESFERLGIPHETPDSELWELCQQHGIVLLTGNRNAEEEDSLETTIATRRTDQSLPVLTIADPDRVMRDREYAARVAERVIEFLVDLDFLRGTGRLYVP